MNPVITTENGAVEGVRQGDTHTFRGIPYAEARRFAVPGPVAAWSGTRDASRHGPICPQPPSRLAPIMGAPPSLPMDEACLTLSVTTPVVDSERPRAVMVWLHGGAYVVGAGSYDWYRADQLVTEGDVVVVSVNYRLGVLGYLRLPNEAEVSGGNLGLLDQIAALQWVKRNIAAFGGDPDNVTVFGESAGGHSVAALMSTADTRGLFRRAILQSAHLGLGFVSVSGAERAGRLIRTLLGDADPRQASVERLLAAQDAASKKLAGPGGLNSAPIFGPVAGVAPLSASAETNIAKAIVQRDVDVLIGSTRDEMRAFFDSNPTVKRLRQLPLGERTWGAIARTVTDRVFAAPARDLADAHCEGGAPVFRYRFEWTPPNGAHGACHTIDLPFVFGNEAPWRGSPMLGTASWSDIDALGRRMRRAWTRFARTGDPNANGDSPWPRHTPGADVGRRFGET